jgi:hypothetical protein
MRGRRGRLTPEHVARPGPLAGAGEAPADRLRPRAARDCAADLREWLGRPSDPEGFSPPRIGPLSGGGLAFLPPIPRTQLPTRRPHRPAKVRRECVPGSWPRLGWGVSLTPVAWDRVSDSEYGHAGGATGVGKQGRALCQQSERDSRHQTRRAARGHKGNTAARACDRRGSRCRPWCVEPLQCYTTLPISSVALYGRGAARGAASWPAVVPI